MFVTLARKHDKHFKPNGICTGHKSSAFVLLQRKKLASLLDLIEPCAMQNSQWHHNFAVSTSSRVEITLNAIGMRDWPSTERFTKCFAFPLPFSTTIKQCTNIHCVCHSTFTLCLDFLRCALRIGCSTVVWLPEKKLINFHFIKNKIYRSISSPFSTESVDSFLYCQYSCFFLFLYSSK